MTLEAVRSVLLWCFVLNYAFLLVWAGVFLFARDGMRNLHGRWFRLTPEQFDAAHYGGMGLYKLGILLFNLAPYIALHIVD